MGKGYAYIDQSGGVFVATVCPTKRGAMVNALVTVFQIPVFQQDSDNHIASEFSKAVADSGCSIRPVTIHVSEVV